MYKLVPEAYHQRFKNWQRKERQTHVEVGRELTAHFDPWCAASNVSTFEELRDLVLLEQFRNIVTDNVATYIMFAIIVLVLVTGKMSVQYWQANRSHETKR